MPGPSIEFTKDNACSMTGIDKVEAGRWDAQCDVCKEHGGAVMSCYHGVKYTKDKHGAPITFQPFPHK